MPLPCVVPLVERFTLRWSVRDLDMRAQLIAKAVEDPLHDQFGSSSVESAQARSKLPA